MSRRDLVLWLAPVSPRYCSQEDRENIAGVSRVGTGSPRTKKEDYKNELS